MKIVIFCGGFGTRMWPVSRKSNPKQFSKIVGGKSFFEKTVKRFKRGFNIDDIYVSTEEKYVHFIKEQAPDIPLKNIIIEPERRDLLGAVGLVAAVIEKHSQGEVMFFSWSDHFIADTDKFINAVKAAGKYTEKTGKPVSVNEKPTFPSVHNGWLEMGEKVDKQDGFTLYQIKRHVEKPKLPTAKEYLKSGNYLIHTGYGAWKSDLMLSYFKEHRPKEHSGLLKIMDAWGTKAQDTTLKREYSKFEKISVEYGLYEHLPKDLRLTIAVETGWEDAGTWQLFYDAMLEKAEDTVVEGDFDLIQLDSFKNLILSKTKKKKIISVVGLKNIAIIETDDALLVCDLDSTQKVKEVFKKLEEKNPEYTQ